MEAVTIFITIAIMLLLGAYLAQPFIASRQAYDHAGTGQHSAARLRERADLFARRNEIYHAITELDFDHRTNKVSDEDYTGQRYRLVAQGVEVLQQLDLLPDEAPESDPIERIIDTLKSGETASPAPAATAVTDEETAGFCPQCGQPYTAGDKFCGFCGTALT